MSAPRVYALTPVRDYADVIEDVLTTAAAWATRVFVLDNGSTDGSREIVERVAAEHDNVEFLGVDERPWSYGYYSVVYQKAKSIAAPGDWWYRLDADEFAVGDPRELLARVAPPYDTVFGSFFCYYFTEPDKEAYERDPVGWNARPLADRIRWYRNDWAEARFVRHRRFMRWDRAGWREGAFNVYPEMVQIRHYQYRSPEQIQQRVTFRASKPAWFYEQPDYQEQFERPLFLTPEPGAPAWHRMIADLTQLDFDDGGELKPRRELLPAIPPLHGSARRVLGRIAASTPIYPSLVDLRDRLRGARRTRSKRGS